MSAALERLHRAGEVDDLDRHFALLLARLDGGHSPLVALAAAEASRATGEGHVCTDLERLASLALDESGTGLAAEAWRETLWSSGVVGGPGDFTPLVLDAAGRLYLWRYHDHEQRIARALAARATATPEVDETLLADGLRRLFPDRAPESPDRQRLAAATAVLRRLAVISGGPGTGKTTTVTRLLALLVEQALATEDPRPPRIALAAPTGKAAARLQDAIRAAREKLSVSDAVRDAIPAEAATLHRLLGVIPGTSRFRHDAANPLPVDAVVVDEASMVDLALMARLVDALPPQARLVLLGDRDQLASVEAGAVLGELCAGAGACTEAFAARLRVIAGEALPSVPDDEAAPLADCVVLLEHSYRFGATSGIGRVARAVRAGDAEEALAVLTEAASDDAVLHVPAAAGAVPLLQAEALSALDPYLALAGTRPPADPATLIDAFARGRTLVAHREGAAGVAGANAAIENALLADGRVLPRGAWYPGRPVMVTRNDYGLRLFNGDTGITVATDQGLRVCFESDDAATPRAVSPGRLPEHATVWAMTVHKSQGSEFDTVVLALPETVTPVLSRELVYTALTRARERVVVLGRAEVLAGAVGARVARRSGLGEALADLVVRRTG